ncbi:Uncharacterised protein [Clostridioides difficile]|nr:Uncharacterised protein [Clostridioides difficile]
MPISFPSISLIASDERSFQPFTIIGALSSAALAAILIASASPFAPTTNASLKEPIAFATATEVVCLSSPASLSIFLVTDSNCFLAVFDTADSPPTIYILADGLFLIISFI